MSNVAGTTINDPAAEARPLLEQGGDAVDKPPFWYRSSFFGIPNYIIVPLLLVVGTLGAGALIAYALAPSIIEDAIKKSEVHFDSMVLTHPKDDSVEFSVVGTLKVSAPMKCRLVTLPLTLYYKNNAVGTFVLKDISISTSGNTKLTNSFRFTVSSLDEWVVFANAMLEEEAVEFTMAGKAEVEAAGLTFHGIDFNKTLTMDGYSGLSNVTLEVFSLERSNATAIVVDMMVDIFNPSTIAFNPIGDLTFDIEFEGAYMGTMHAGDVSIGAGSNFVHMSGVLGPTNLTAASNLFSLFLSGQPCRVTAVAPAHVSSVPLYNTALHGVSLVTTLAAAPFQLVKTMEFTSMVVDPIDDSTVAMTGSTLVSFFNPLGNQTELNIEEISFVADMYNGSTVLGTLVSHKVVARPLANNTGLIDVPLNASLTLVDDGLPFATFLEEFLKLPSVSLSVRGRAAGSCRLPIGVVSLTNVSLEATVFMAGMSGLPNVTVESISLPRDAPGPPGSGVVAIANATVFNPSPVSVNLGGVTLALIDDGYTLGVMTTHLHLVPGWNAIVMEGILNPSSEALPTVSNLVTNYIHNIPTPVTVQGLTSNQPILWVNEAVSQLTLHSTLPGSGGISLIKNVTLETLGVSFFSYKAPRSAAQLAVQTNDPFGITVDILTIELELLFQSADRNQTWAVMHTPATAANENVTTGVLHMDFAYTSLDVVNEPLMANIVVGLLLEPSVTIGLSGVGTAVASTNMGLLSIAGVSYGDVTTLVGADGFNDPPILIESVTLTGGYPGHCTMTVALTITNPSNVNALLGNLTLGFEFEGTPIGNASLSQTYLAIGPNALVGYGFYVPEPGAPGPASNFLSRYMGGFNSTVHMVGLPTSSPIPVLQPAASQLNTSVTVPGQHVKLVKFVHLSIEIVDFLLHHEVTIQVTLVNPFDLEVQIHALDFNVYNEDKLIALFNPDLSTSPFVLEPLQSTVQQPEVAIVEGLTLELIEKFVEEGIMDVFVEGSLEIQLENFRGSLTYQQNAEGSFHYKAAPPPPAPRFVLDA